MKRILQSYTTHDSIPPHTPLDMKEYTFTKHITNALFFKHHAELRSHITALQTMNNINISHEVHAKANRAQSLNNNETYARTKEKRTHKDKYTSHYSPHAHTDGS